MRRPAPANKSNKRSAPKPPPFLQPRVPSTSATPPAGSSNAPRLEPGSGCRAAAQIGVMSIDAPSAPPPGEWLETTTIFPPGLHSLMHLDRVYLDRAKDGLEAAQTWDTTKRYRFTDAEGERLFVALEESNPCGRFCLSGSHPWTFHLLDDTHREILLFRRSLRCTSCCFPCCLQKLTVHANGTMLGCVTQCWNPCRPSFAIRNAANETVLTLRGPCGLRCAGDTQFKIKSSDGKHRVGAIAQKCTGLAREFVQDGDSVLVGFPRDLDVKIKAVLLAASLLLDYMYFEDD